MLVTLGVYRLVVVLFPYALSPLKISNRQNYYSILDTFLDYEDKWP